MSSSQNIVPNNRHQNIVGKIIIIFVQVLVLVFAHLEMIKFSQAHLSLQANKTYILLFPLCCAIFLTLPHFSLLSSSFSSFVSFRHFSTTVKPQLNSDNKIAIILISYLTEWHLSLLIQFVEIRMIMKFSLVRPDQMLSTEPLNFSTLKSSAKYEMQNIILSFLNSQVSSVCLSVACQSSFGNAIIITNIIKYRCDLWLYRVGVIFRISLSANFCLPSRY